MNKLEILGRIAELDAQIKALKKELDAAKQKAILNGFAVWKYTMNGNLSTKAPDMIWWKEHRGQSFQRLCDRSANPEHPDHKAFWKKPTPRFTIA
jgi:hypothetical protein